MKSNPIDHITIMIGNVKKTEKFYSKIFGKPVHRDNYSVAWKFGDTKLFFGLPFKKLANNTFNRNRIGLNHLAWRARTLDDLRKRKDSLDKAGIKNSGIIRDKYKHREYIWFNDPDGIRQEFYLRPAHDT